MCGIVGLFRRPNKKFIDSNKIILEMMDKQKHRGPDDEGIAAYRLGAGRGESLPCSHIAEGVYDGMIGFNRLSIQDLSQSGHQPMLGADNRVILVYNGEIYNKSEMMEELLCKGYVFNGSSDTEVILNYYIENGIDLLLSKMNGMYAVSILDLRINRMFLFRDRLGIKPLYYTFTNSCFAISSEIKSLLCIKDFDYELDMKNLGEHISILKPEHTTLFKNVEMIVPGSVVTLNLETFELNTSTYFDIDSYERPLNTNRTLEDCMEETEQVLIDCIERQKISDVKFGSQLSGGVDSSLITYFASKYGENPLRDAVSIIFDGEEREYSEEPYVDFLLSRVNISSHKKVIDESYFIENLECACWHADSIIGRPNSIGLMLLSKFAKNYVTVLLSGEGADELTGGYAMFPKGELYRRENINERELANYAVSIQQITDKEMVKALMPEYDMQQMLDSRIDYFRSLQGTYFDKQIKYALKSYLPELLVCQDKMSMANSIENRVPFLDYRFMDLLFTVPKDYLLYISKTITKLSDYKDISENATGKLLLKKICEKHLGKNFAYRRKMGFGIPYYRYFKRNKVFLEYYQDQLLPGIRERGIFDIKLVDKLYADLGTVSYEHNEIFWKIINFEIWCQLFIDKRERQKIS